MFSSRIDSGELKFTVPKRMSTPTAVIAEHSGVRSDEEVREHIRVGPAFAAIVNVRLTRKKRSGARNVKNADFHRIEPVIDFSLAGKRDRNL